MKINELKKLIQEIKLREALQSGIQQVKHPFKALFIFGPAGSGKTYIIDKGIKLPDSFMGSAQGINTDNLVEEVFPRFQLSLNFEQGEVEVKQELRKLLQDATGNITKAQVNKCKPLVFDTTGEKIGKMRTIIRELVNVGYDVAIFQINVPPAYSVFSDQKRGEEGKRTVGREKTREIANDYQIKVVRGAAYLQLGQERGVTLLNEKVYPNIFDLKTGKLRANFVAFAKTLQDDSLELQDPEGVRPSGYIRNPFKGANWEAAKDILDTAQENLTQWLSDPLPENPTGQALYDALNYIQEQKVGMLGDQITDVAEYAAWAVSNDVAIPSVVDQALYLTVGIKAKFEKTVPPPKYAEHDPKYFPMKVKYKGPEYGKKGAPTGREIAKRKPLEECLNYLKSLIQEVKAS